VAAYRVCVPDDGGRALDAADCVASTEPTRCAANNVEIAYTPAYSSLRRLSERTSP
jgi:hypothetical protein